MTVTLGNHSASYGTKEFEDIINTNKEQCCNQTHLAFQIPIKLFIRGRGFPNIEFTDLPGLTTIDKPLFDFDPTDPNLRFQTIKQMVQANASQENTVGM